MKKVLGLTLGTCLAIAAQPSFALDPFTDNVSIYVTALYTKPSNNGLSIGGYPSATASNGIFHTIDRLNSAAFLSPGYSWDWSYGLSYHFPCTDTRGFLEFDYFGDNDKRHVPGGSLTVNPEEDDLEYSVTGDVAEKMRSFRIGLTHNVNIGCRMLVDLAGFFEYNKLSRGVHIWNPVRLDEDEIATYYQEANNRVRGWGPGVGIKLSGSPSDCYNNFKLFAGLRTSVFYAFNNYSMSSWIGGISENETQLFYFEPESSHSLVTKLDVNLGMDYRCLLKLFGCKTQTEFTLGARYINYLNVFKNGNNAPASYAVNSSTFPSFPIHGVSNDWGRVGPYLQFRIGGCNA